MTTDNFTIGALAKRSRVNIETIRFYQRRGLLFRPAKPATGARRYTEHDAQRIRFIKQGQKLGFSLDEIAELLSIENGQQCQQAQEIAQRKLIQIRERIDALRAMEIALLNLLEQCSHNTTSILCPIILSLQGISE